MKIVIDIKDDDYYDIIGDALIGEITTREIINNIKNGTPLPKGHGRLIDADAFIAKMEDASKRQQYKKLLIDNYLTVDDVFNAIIESLQNKGLANGDAATIIEADTESEDRR